MKRYDYCAWVALKAGIGNAVMVVERNDELKIREPMLTRWDWRISRR